MSVWKQTSLFRFNMGDCAHAGSPLSCVGCSRRNDLKELTPLNLSLQRDTPLVALVGSMLHARSKRILLPKD